MYTKSEFISSKLDECFILKQIGFRVMKAQVDLPDRVIYAYCVFDKSEYSSSRYRLPNCRTCSTHNMFDEAKMKTLSYSLMVGGMALALGGVVAVFNFDQPSDMFSLAWWMIVGGWCLVFTGMGVDIMQLFRAGKHEPVYVYQQEMRMTQGAGEEISRM
jgi:hypothetical protein